MSYAVAFPTRRSHPDAVRIAALSAAISVNLCLMVAALRPLASDLIRPAPEESVPTLRFEDAPKPVLPAPALPTIKPLPHRTPIAAPTVPVPSVEPSTFSIPAPPTVSQPLAPVAPSIAPATPVTSADVPHQVTLAYLEAPLPVYPTQARRQHMQGTVILRVRVDASGHPTDVEVEQSSGYPLLDRSAREQVLRRWRFQPARQGGHAVGAWGRVPIHFNLR